MRSDEAMLSIPIYSTTGISLIHRGAHPILAESTTATLLLAELRGYNELAEQVPAVNLVPILAECFALFSRAVLQYGGQIFGVSDGGMMAAFGVCDPCHTHSNDALFAANTIQRRFTKLREAWRKELSIDAGMGIGIHRGEIAVGLFGPPGHELPMLVGDTVNVAAQLCARARDGEALMSAVVNSFRHLHAHHPDTGEPMPVPSMHLGELKLRGRQRSLDAWCLLTPEHPEQRTGTEVMRGVSR